MSVTVSTVPIKLYITDPESNTAYPVGGVLTQGQQDKIDEAYNLASDALLKNSEEEQIVNSNSTFEQPVHGINSAGDDGMPTSNQEFITYGTLLCILDPIQAAVDIVNSLPDVENIAVLDQEQSFTASKDFASGLTTASVDDVEAASDNAVLNKSDTEKLVESMADQFGSADVHIVTEYPEEDAMEKGHIYVRLPNCC